MNRSVFKRLLWIPVIAASFGINSLGAVESSVPAPSLKHMCADGRVIQALLFQMREQSLGRVAHDHLVFVDTSASQIGNHRSHALAVLRSMLDSLPETDRIRLYAIDVQADPLMDSMAGPKSDATMAGIEALNSRIPLGATRLQSVVQTALETSDADRSCSITYIGDGLSTAELLKSKELASMVSDLRGRKIPFHCYGVGPEVNLQLLGVMAHQTGGFVDFDSGKDIDLPHGPDLRKSESFASNSGSDRKVQNEDAAAKLAAASGQRLAQAVQRPVFFPTSVKVVSVEAQSLPLLPLRTDRETIHVIRGTLPADARVVFSAEDTNETLEWKLSAPVEQTGSAFLAAVAQEMDQDQGLSNSLAGRSMMDIYQGAFVDSMENALKSATQHLKFGKPEQAAQIAEQVAQVDPQNLAAKSLVASSKRLQVNQVSQLSTDDNPPPPEPGGELDNRVQPDANSSLTREQEQAIRVKTEKLRNQVSNAIGAARKSTDPEASLGQLKQVDNAVKSSIDIAPEDRLQMQKQLESEINQMKNVSDKQAQEKVQLAEELSQLEAQRRLTEELLLDEGRLEGLIDRVRALMREGFHGREDAFSEAQNVADVAINLRPGEGTSSAARFNAEAAHQLARAVRLRARRADQFLEALYLVELAHIPFPDEPPIRFPNAEVWKSLTERRRKWATVDLRKDSPNEQRIQEELKKPTEVQFTDQPLKDALDFLEDLHNIEIIIDTPALADEGISTDQNVNLVLSGITLRSALRLLLEPLQLTYVIEDEVMKITTNAKAAEILTTRVYPVADLVVRITAPQGGGGGMGGMGGGMGGMGGGMGGMGGGMGGMGGGMGGGGGFFNIPPEPVPQNLNNAADAPKLDNKVIQGVKKKRTK